MNKRVNLAASTIDNSDIDSLVEWLKTYPRLTKGDLTVEFEKQWSEWLGVKYSVFLNSGSSANLLMIYGLIISGKLKNKKVVVPALSWATDLAPVMQFGLIPIMADCNMMDLSVDIESLEEIFKKDNPGALLLVSVLGFVPDMDRIIGLCKKYDVVLLEDNCESLGSKYKNKKLGGFGLMASFSLFYGHHLSTIEGGMICTDDEEMYDLMKMLRSHGWTRDLEKEKQELYKNKWSISQFNDLYTFYVPGFNVRSTDLQAFIGIGQLKKADQVCEVRNRNFLGFDRFIKNDYWKIPKCGDEDFISNFCYPIIHPNRDKIVERLRENNIEVRPLIAGSLATQPFYVEKYGKLELSNVSIIDKFGCYIPNHHNITLSEVEFICEIINKAIEQ